MRLKHIYIVAVLSAFTIAAFSCSDINSKHQEWLDLGEKVYSGRLDSVRVRGGYGRMALEGGTSYIRTAVKATLQWDDNVLEYKIDEIVDGGIARIILEDMEEGSYRFFLTTYDSDGNNSVPDECFGYSYGEDYRAFANKKVVVGIEGFYDKAVLTCTTSDNIAYVQIDYTDRDGRQMSETFPGDETTIEIASWKAGSMFTATTYSLPEENALDVIPLEPLVYYFPTEFLLPKTTFETVILPTDIDGMGYSGIGAKGMWDGIYANTPAGRYHSRDQEGVPHHLTFDMGILADLSRVKIYGSSDGSFWNPKRFQLWGRADLNGAQTTLASDDAGWEAEMLDKGWVLIIDATNPDRVENEHVIADHDPRMVRYIRYRIVENVGPPDGSGPNSGKSVYGLCQELDFWVTDALQIDR